MMCVVLELDLLGVKIYLSHAHQTEILEPLTDFFQNFRHGRHVGGHKKWKSFAQKRVLFPKDESFSVRTPKWPKMVGQTTKN